MTYQQLAQALVGVANEKSEWAGLPMPLPGFRLVVEPKFPYQLGQFGPQEKYDENDAVVVNSWWSDRLRAFVVISKTKEGKIIAGVEAHNQATVLIETLGAVTAWQETVEWKAMEKLQSLVTDHALKCYILTGTFLETSKRSGITYMFRRLRPTLAIKATDSGVKVLCGLCAHSIGYYSETWAGVLTPTDEVVAHLVFMRGDEPKFWRQCNQHSPNRTSCGL